MIYKKIVVKVGSNVLTRDDGLPNLEAMKHLADQISYLKSQGVDVVLVSSGAVAAGRSIIKEDGLDALADRQLLASIGQVKLINHYLEIFSQHSIICAQVLVTKEDFRDRNHYLNMRNCMDSLMNKHVLPIVNENDVISVNELMFTDNDELAGMIASMIHAEAMVLLTNVSGVYDGDPSLPNTKILRTIDSERFDFDKIAHGTKSNFGRGGIITKFRIAHKLSQTGIPVHIANGKEENTLIDVVAGKEEVGTKFISKKAMLTPIKQWIAHAEDYAKGYVVVNQGARDVLLSDKKAVSLLPVGITRIEGNFKKGDIINIYDDQGVLIGIGKTQYGSKKAKDSLGLQRRKPFIHYDYLFIDSRHKYKEEDQEKI